MHLQVDGRGQRIVVASNGLRDIELPCWAVVAYARLHLPAVGVCIEAVARIQIALVPVNGAAVSRALCWAMLENMLVWKMEHPARPPPVLLLKS